MRLDRKAVLDRTANFIDRINTVAGYVAGALTYLLLAAVILHVVLRYGFSLNLTQLEEVHWHLYGAAFLLGLGYAYLHDAHVRIDLFYERIGARTKAWIEVLGIVFLLLPFCLVISYFAAEFFWQSWSVGEVADQIGGLPARYILKFVLLAAIVLLGLQALSALIRAVLVLTHPKSK
ncbi:MAG: TRAP transporter small permease subunit [Bradyrhizobiaceae bacterium]|nr:TRAP transporter small permease subunit [Bradyrhizobiaceae bacterium]